MQYIYYILYICSMYIVIYFYIIFLLPRRDIISFNDAIVEVNRDQIQLLKRLRVKNIICGVLTGFRVCIL